MHLSASLEASSLQMDDDEGSPLPSWLHFDENELSFWGMARPGDVSGAQVRVVEMLPKATGRLGEIVVGRVLFVVVQ